jgi:hypothetical protein
MVLHLTALASGPLDGEVKPEWLSPSAVLDAVEPVREPQKQALAGLSRSGDIKKSKKQTRVFGTVPVESATRSLMRLIAGRKIRRSGVDSSV